MFVIFKIRKLSGYSFHLNLMTEGENVEGPIVFKTLVISISPTNCNTCKLVKDKSVNNSKSSNEYSHN